MPNPKSILETATNVALLIVCSMLVWLFAAHRDLWLHGNQRTVREAEVLIGKALNPFPEYDWKGHDRTLVLAIRQGCGFCEASMPFYKRLSELQNAHRLGANLLVVMPDPATAAALQLRSGGVNVDSVFEQPLNTLHVSATPTLLLVSAQGKVMRAWIGQLTSAEETEVMAALRETVAARN